MDINATPDRIEINGVTYVREQPMTENVVIVRTYSAGVHVGTLIERNGREVKLANARNVWRWRGANTLNEMALHGVDSAEASGYTRVSEAVPEVLLTEAIEILPCSAEAARSIAVAGWAK